MRHIVLFLLLLAAGVSRSGAQTRVGLDSLFRVLVDSFPQQKVYLHLDRDRYMAGDTLWFKAYLRTMGFPGGGNSGLHVELLNGEGTRITHKLYAVRQQRTATGEIELGDSLPQGLYTIRAYTEWMSNFDPSFFYSHTFPVLGKRRIDPVSPPDVPGLDVQFLPEGGDLVDNVPGYVAFKAVDQRDLPVSVRGKVISDLDSVVAVSRFKSDHDGMGVFDLVPQKGRVYTAVLWTPYGERRLPLPRARPDGVALHLSNDRDGVRFTLLADSLSRYMGRPLRVTGHLFGQLVFTAELGLTRRFPESKGFIALDKLLPGVLTLTLFSEDDGEPLAERAVFIRPPGAEIPATLTFDTLSTAPKGRNSWNLHFSDTTRKYLSVSITDADALEPGSDRPDILTGLLLRGDVRGHVPHAAAYFANDADSTRAFLDLVMMTQGWRRYDWKALEAGHFPEIRYSNDKDYLTIEGQALAAVSGKPLVNTRLTFILRHTDSTKKIYTVPLDSAGNFMLDGLSFVDTTTAYFQANKKGEAGLNVRVRLKQDPTFPTVPEDQQGVIFPFDAKDTVFADREQRQAVVLAEVRRLQHAKEIKEIVITGRRKPLMEELDKKYTHGVFVGQFGGYAFDVAHDSSVSLGSFPNPIEYMSYLVPGVRWEGTMLVYRNSRDPVHFFLDEVPINQSALQQISMVQIAYIKFLMPPFVGDLGGGAGGAFAIYTYKGEDRRSNKGLNGILLSGYARVRQFYAPVYDARDTADRSHPDYRVTLAWLPSPDTGGRAAEVPVRFYNNDACRNFRIVVEGMDESGHLLHLERMVGNKND